MYSVIYQQTGIYSYYITQTAEIIEKFANSSRNPFLREPNYYQYHEHYAINHAL